MSRYRVLVTDYAWPDLDVEREILAAAGADIVIPDSVDTADLARAAAGVDAVLVCWAPVTAEVIAAAPTCQIVARMGIGLDNIDVEYCSSHGIPVTNVPDYCVLEVAEHALSLMFALARGVGQFHHACQQGNYDPLASPRLGRIEGATLGLIGLGRIGGRVAEKALRLGMRVLGSTRSQQSQLTGIELVDIDTLLKSSDFVSLHAPLTAATKHMIGATQLAQMRPSGYLINTSRGGLIDHAALAEALAAGTLAGAGLDVQEPEPPPLNQSPFNDPRVIVTPHVAFVSPQSVLELRRRSATQVAVRLSGELPENVVNGEELT